MSKQFIKFIKCKKMYCLLELQLPSALLSQGTDVTITAAIATALCRRSGFLYALDFLYSKQKRILAKKENHSHWILNFRNST